MWSLLLTFLLCILFKRLSLPRSLHVPQGHFMSFLVMCGFCFLFVFSVCVLGVCLALPSVLLDFGIVCKSVMQPRLASHLCSEEDLGLLMLMFPLPGAGVTHMHHHAQFIPCWSQSSGYHTY